MKRAQLVLWVLTPVLLLAVAALVLWSVPLPFWLADTLVSLVFLLPVTAMFLRTLQNKKKNLNINYFILKIVFLILLYAMILYWFVMMLLIQR